MRVLLPRTLPILIVLSCVVGAAPITSLVSTGMASQGSQDPNWLYRSNSSAPFVSAYVTAPNSSNNFPFNVWLPNSSTSQWISPNPVYGTDSGVYGDGAAAHQFRLIFTLPLNADLSTATFSYRLAVDDRLGGVYLNGYLIQSDPLQAFSYTSISPVLTVGPGYFLPGTNILDVFVQNNPGMGAANIVASWNPVALRLEFVSSNVELLPPPPPGAEIPEPGSLLLTGIGLSALGLTRIRRGDPR